MQLLANSVAVLLSLRLWYRPLVSNIASLYRCWVEAISIQLKFVLKALQQHWLGQHDPSSFEAPLDLATNILLHFAKIVTLKQFFHGVLRIDSHAFLNENSTVINPQ